jgi:hypothetical protein
MKIPSLDFLKGASDRDRLVGFIFWLGAFLGELVNETRKRTSDNDLFERDLPDGVLEAIEDAWKEIQEKQLITKAANRQKDISDVELEESGLTGRQLSLKFRALHWICEKFRLNSTAGWLRRVLKSVDDILGSMAEGNVMAHALKEFKEVLESLARQE